MNAHELFLRAGNAAALSDRDGLRQLAKASGWTVEGAQITDKFRNHGTVITVWYQGVRSDYADFEHATHRGDYGTVSTASIVTARNWLR